jgi:hypothetical protein
MKAYPNFIAEVRSGQLLLKQKNMYDRFLLTNFKDGAIVEVQIKPYRKTRSAKTNNYYWLYLNVIADETGDNVDDLHEFFKRKLLQPRFVKVMKQEVKMPATTTTLTSNEFSEYIEKIEALTGIPSPVPDWEK